MFQTLISWCSKGHNLVFVTVHLPYEWISLYLNSHFIANIGVFRNLSKSITRLRVKLEMWNFSSPSQNVLNSDLKKVHSYCLNGQGGPPQLVNALVLLFISLIYIISHETILYVCTKLDQNWLKINVMIYKKLLPVSIVKKL